MPCEPHQRWVESWENDVYNVGFAVHDDNVTTRGHHVSLVKTLGLDTKKANIQAVKLP